METDTQAGPDDPKPHGRRRLRISGDARRRHGRIGADPATDGGIGERLLVDRPER
ncbi:MULTISPECIES: hypothetical protein [Methylobacterium]|jgi:hypothetical protein|uniref:Uncharacterized protein n=1 Tax=Methylobacterium fujisawaense TaxID=107400 RepID=A0ABR6DIY3_9HYPH|nr:MULTISPECIES: hypothetical protein [Methylobacterium]MBA9066051.1 hypothetical protein [Methylobacterium fujisawaense]